MVPKRGTASQSWRFLHASQWDFIWACKTLMARGRVPRDLIILAKAGLLED